MINVNRLNQNNQYNLGNPNIQTKRAELIMRETHQSTGNVGKMIPFMFHEMLPSENTSLGHTAHIQFMPFIKNLMHEMQAEITTYFVPNRIIWKDWEKYITGCDEENDIVDGTLEVAMDYINIAKTIKNSDIETDETKTRITNRLKKISEKEIYYGESGFMTRNITADIAFQIITEIADMPQETALRLTYEWIIDTDTATTTEQIHDSVIAVFFGYYRNQYAARPIVEEPLLNTIFGAILEETIIDYMGLPINSGWSQTIIAQAGQNDKDWLQSKLGTDYANFMSTAEAYNNSQGKIVNLPIKAINKIYNDWIRQLDWETKRNELNIALPQANYFHDYYTRARRFAYRGAVPSVPVDLITPKKAVSQDEKEPFTIEDGVIGTWKVQNMMSAAAILNYYLANAKIKPRYSNQLLARWGVNIQDERFQYAHFVHSELLTINQQGVVQQAPGGSNETQLGDIQGQMWANGTTQAHFRAPEHGWLISYLIVRPANVYEQGVEKKFIKKSKFDYATPEMVDLPDVPIYAHEITHNFLKDEVIGWASIYDEYRTKTNRVTGLLRPSIGDGMHAYTLSRQIEDSIVPTQKDLMRRIIKCIPPMERIKIYTDEPDFMFFCASNFLNRLPLPYKTDPRVML